MARVLPRTNFHSSKLIRCLADLAIADAMEPGNAFAEKLGQWIHFADAITLSAVHNGGMANLPEMRRETQVVASAAACLDFDRAQAFLMNSIVASCAPGSGKSRIRLPEPKLELPLDLAAAYLPYRRFYEAHQRDMELGIQPLRANLREAAAKASPRLSKLADLDATLENILREREYRLLLKVPVLLRKRFEHLFNEHQRKLEDTRQDDDPSGWILAGGWLARFCNDMQMLLQAELEFRLQPSLGLVEAFKQDTQ